MATLILSNKLYAPNVRDFQFSADNGSTWTDYPIGDYAPPDIADKQTCHFKIKSGRIHNSSIAVSLKGFTHALELVDKCSTSENFMLLRFVPKKIGDGNTPDIKVECLLNRLYPESEPGDFHYLTMQLSNYKYLRNTIMNKTSALGVVFDARYSFNTQDLPICIGDLKADETLEIHLDGSRPQKKSHFLIFSNAAIFKKVLRFIDINDDPTPHLELIIEDLDGGPETINITVNGDET